MMGSFSGRSRSCCSQCWSSRETRAQMPVCIVRSDQIRSIMKHEMSLCNSLICNAEPPGDDQTFLKHDECEEINSIACTFHLTFVSDHVSSPRSGEHTSKQVSHLAAAALPA